MNLYAQAANVIHAHRQAEQARLDAATTQAIAKCRAEWRQRIIGDTPVDSPEYVILSAIAAGCVVDNGDEQEGDFGRAPTMQMSREATALFNAAKGAGFLNQLAYPPHMGFMARDEVGVAWREARNYRRATAKNLL